MSLAPEQLHGRVTRRFTSSGASPYDGIEWQHRDARLIDHRDGSVAFEQLGVEFPADWSVTASNIVTQKYFRGSASAGTRESSLRQVIDRVVGAITAWGVDGGYFADPEEASAFADELRHLLVHQYVSFNSPVWFNIGVPDVAQQASACFILDVEDDLRSILNWYTEEGIIFKGGSGAGANLSKIRSSKEELSAGGTPSGPVSFMRGADASAGTIKSGGTTRRAAKMVILDADHPDISEFIWCKAREERKARVLRDAGFDMDLDGADSASVQYQNANNSVRLTDEFMIAALEDRDWALTARTDGRVIDRVPARQLLREVAEASWECADPGVQFDTTINRWNTTPSAGRIEASNPCSEHLRLKNSACNLASLNLLKFLDELGSFDVEAFEHSVQVVTTAQDILVGASDYPTDKIAEMTAKSRDIGLGYTNLGACLMALGFPYDSEPGRAWAAAVTGILTGAAASRSTLLAERLGPAPLFDADRDAWAGVYDLHLDAARSVDEVTGQPELNERLVELWQHAADDVRRVGARNAELTVAAPTGTISFMMGADTTGIEPDLGLVKFKKLVGGGTLEIVNQTVPRALRRLGYDDEQVSDIVAHIAEHHSAIGAPHLDPEHVAVFACAIGDNVISYGGHLRMMAAIQPFFSGAMSKTVNVPESTTVEEIEQLLIDAWRAGIKCVALYRDNCKVAQPLSSGTAASNAAKPDAPGVGPGAVGVLAVGAVPDAGPAEVVAGIVGQVARPTARTHAAVPPFSHLRVPCCRLQGIRHGRGVPRRATGRAVHPCLEAGLDPRRHHGRVRHLGQPRSAVRRAAAGIRARLRRHALRARRDHRRSRGPHRQQLDRLPVPSSGARVHAVRGATRTGHPRHLRAAPAHAARCRGACDADRAGTRPGSVQAEWSAAGRAGATRGARPRGSSARAGSRGAAVHAVRNPDDSCGLLLCVRRVRHHQRLQLRARSGSCRWRPASLAAISVVGSTGLHDPLPTAGSVVIMRDVDFQRLIDDCTRELDEGGFTVAALVGDEMGCDWAYTIGLHRNFEHPELLLVGLEAPVAGAVLELMGNRIAAGDRLDDGRALVMDGGLEFRARPVDAVFRSQGDWFNLGREVMSHWGERWPLSLQLVWSDPGEEFPSHPADPRWAMRQPLLFSS